MENLEINKLKISLAGQNLLTIFYAILTTLFLSVIFISMLFMEIISYDAVLLIMCIIEFVMFIIVLSNLYKAGTNLKNAVLVNLPNNQQISMADQHSHEEYIKSLQTKEPLISSTIAVTSNCPACSSPLDINPDVCPQCGLNFN